MSRAILSLLLPLTLFAATEAQACRIARPGPFPIRAGLPYDAVALATVTRGQGEARDVRIDLVFDGATDARALPLNRPLGPNEVVITCGTPPAPAPGDQIVVLIRRFHGQAQVAEWTSFAYAADRDDFFRLYRDERSAAARRRLRARWRDVVRRGPTPLTALPRWAVPYTGNLGYGHGPQRTLAIVEIGQDGRVSSCHTVDYRGSPPRELRVCERLTAQRFRPPVLARERQGQYEIHWRAETRPAR